MLIDGRFIRFSSRRREGFDLIDCLFHGIAGRKLGEDVFLQNVEQSDISVVLSFKGCDTIGKKFFNSSNRLRHI